MSEKKSLQEELDFIRNSLRTLQSQNADLREKHREAQNKLVEKDKECSKKIGMLERESKILRSQMSFLGPSSSNKINMQYALRDFIQNEKLTDIHTFLERVRFFRDYFFDDFFSLDLSSLIETLGARSLPNEAFVQLFLLLGSKKDFYDAFQGRFFSLSGFVEEKLHVLNSVSPEWLLDSHQRFSFYVSEFLKLHEPLLTPFFIRLANLKPTLLPDVLSRSSFDRVVCVRGDSQWRQLAYAICKNIGKHYITPANLHLLPKEALSCYFGVEYVDIDLAGDTSYRYTVSRF